MDQLTPELAQQIAQLLSAGKRIEAIKLYREIANCDLRTGVEAITQMAGGAPDRPQRSLVGWAVFAIVLLIFISAPAYMIYNAWKQAQALPAPVSGSSPVSTARPSPPANGLTPPPSPAVPSPARPSAVVGRPAIRRFPTSGPMLTNLPPLTAAIFSGQLDRALNLINTGSDVNVVATDMQNWTPLIAATFRAGDGAFEVVEALVAKGAHINARSSGGYTPLMLAVRHHSPKTVDFLIAHEADVNIATRRGETALDWAKQGNQTELIQVLEKAGAKSGTPSVEAPKKP